VVVNSEIQPPDLAEEEAFKLVVAQSDLGDLGRWNGLGFQLRESALAQGALVPCQRVSTPALHHLCPRIRS
jgi:hypothetical protein